MRQSRLQLRAPGFSLIELMVAMVIGLIGMIIIFQVFEVSEGIRRTTTSGGDAQQNGTIALYLMQRDLRNAGMGFNDTPYAGCSMAGYDSTQAPTKIDFAQPIVGLSSSRPRWQAIPKRRGCAIPWPSIRIASGSILSRSNAANKTGLSRKESKPGT